MWWWWFWYQQYNCTHDNNSVNDADSMSDSSDSENDSNDDNNNDYNDEIYHNAEGEREKKCKTTMMILLLYPTQ